MNFQASQRREQFIARSTKEHFDAHVSFDVSGERGFHSKRAEALSTFVGALVSVYSYVTDQVAGLLELT